MNVTAMICLRQGGACPASRPQRPGAAFGARLALGLVPAFLALVLCAWPSQALASWLVDQNRFHVSAHASLGCSACHGDITPGKDHPNPADVIKTGDAFFKADTCLGCHADVGDGLAKGSHGGKPLDKGQDYQRCVTCHDPHYQTAQKLPKGFDPAKPVAAQCGACHDKRTQLPALDKADEACMSCHRAYPGQDAASRAAASKLCLECHGAKAPQGFGAMIGLATMDAASQAAATHKDLSCLQCHKDGARFPHNKQERVSCATCHNRHDEKVTHDLHASVTCEACHLSGAAPSKDPATGIIGAKLEKPEPGKLLVHSMTLPEGEASCRRCHFAGNTLGAAASILPAKSVICLPCHAATFSVSDTTSILSLLALLGGLCVLGMFWFATGGLGSGPAKATVHGPAKAGTDWARLGEVAFYDVFLQRRLYRESPGRFAVHALIYFPFVFRFLWGMLGLLGSLVSPGARLPWLMLDKNSLAGGFLYDLSGLLLLVGLLLAAWTWLRRRDDAGVSGLPGRDWPALLLLMAIVVVGFVLEGMRIAMTGLPAGSAASFVGYALARGFGAEAAAGLSQAYGTVWYLHAILTGVTVAYLPFSQLRHVVTAPLAMLLGARGKHE